MVRMILIGISAVVVLFVLVVATRPPTIHIERSITIAAPPEHAFVHVNDFRAWPSWSPYEKKDPQMKRTLSGPPAGTGAMYAWAGNNEVGEGRMTIVESNQPSKVGIKLEFSKPFAATNTATFTFVPGPGGTKVTWAMDGQNTLMSKVISLFMNFDKMVGGDFERGLVALKTIAETQATSTGDSGLGRDQKRA